jgi:hypothetical protein
MNNRPSSILVDRFSNCTTDVGRELGTEYSAVGVRMLGMVAEI